MKFPEKFRADHPFLPLKAGDPEGGYFKVPHQELEGHAYLCVATIGKAWEHVAVALSGAGRCPTWEEMCFIKSMFWDPEEAVMQLHPPESEWISNHPYCLHLWRPLTSEIPLPPSEMVGIKA